MLCHYALTYSIEPTTPLAFLYYSDCRARLFLVTIPLHHWVWNSLFCHFPKCKETNIEIGQLVALVIDSLVID